MVLKIIHSNIGKTFFLSFTILLIAALGTGFYHKLDRTTLLYWWHDWLVLKDNHTKLMGSSTIHRLPLELVEQCESPVSYGFDNGTTESLYKYLKGANLRKAQNFIIYIGENDIARGKTALQTFQELKQIIAFIQQKSTAKIGVLSLKYSPRRASKHAEFLKFNNMLKRELVNVDGREVISFDRLVKPSLFISDGIHLSNSGYLELSNIINQFCKSN